MISKKEQAEFLAEATPYIKKYNDRTLVIKYDGNAMIDEELKASVIAGELQAESLILMTDIRRLLEDKDDETTLIKKVVASDVLSLVKRDIISGGMIPKIECCKETIRRGVQKVFITDGRVNHSILMELLSDEGMGTMLVNGD